MKIRHLIALVAAFAGVFAVSAATQTKQELFDTAAANQNTKGKALTYVIANAAPSTALTVTGGVVASTPAAGSPSGRNLQTPLQFASVVNRSLGGGPVAFAVPEPSTYAAAAGCAAIVGFTWMRRKHQQA